MKRLMYLVVVITAVALGLLFALKTSPIDASRGETTACNSCHTYPSASLRVTTDITTKTVSPGQSFPVNISWLGGSNGRRIEINWPNTQSNTLFNPTPRIPSSATADSGTTQSTLTAPTTPGTYTVRVFAARSLPTRDTYYASITITVAQGQANVAPVLSAIGNKSVTAGQQLQFTVSATDADGNALTYSASNLPSGASFNASTHTFAWTPASAGTYANVTFQVTDGTLTASEAITITVTQANVAPVLSPIGNKSGTVGQQLQFTVSATDADGDALTYSASNLPSGASFNASNHTFAWTPASAGTYANVTFQVTDGSLTASEAITITVTTAANSPPVLNPIGDKLANAEHLLSFTISATDANGDALTYSVTNLPSGASFNASTHTFTWTPDENVIGVYHDITFQVSDGSLTDSEIITITVAEDPNNVAPVLSPIGNKSVTTGQLLQFVVYATDANGNALTYSASNLPSGASFNASTRTFSWTPASAGTYANVTFQVTDGTLTASEAITITVTQANVAPVLSPIGNKSGTVGQQFQFTVSATDADGDALTYSASNLPSGASFNASNHTFAWTPASAGTYANVTFQVTDGSLTASEAITITVAQGQTNVAPVLSSIGSKSVTAGQLLQFTISATDANGDALTYSASNLPSGASFNATTHTFAWTPASAGTYGSVGFQVSDGSLTASEAIIITVTTAANLPPVLNPIGDKLANAEHLLSFTISATDANGDALIYSASNLPSGASFNTSTNTFSWTPASAGTYTNVTFQVSDGALIDSEVITITVTIANVAPVLSPIGNRSVTAGQTLQFNVSATDADGDALTYSASNLPSGASFNASTHTFSWTPASAGTYSSVGFQVSDGSLTASEAITITVTQINVAPVLSPVGNQAVVVGQTLTFTVSATDANGDVLTYSAANLPAGATFNPSTHTFTWTPASSQTGKYTNLHLEVSDGVYAVSENVEIVVGTGQMPVLSANVAPVLNHIGGQRVTAGQILQFMVSATDANLDPLVYAAVNLPPGAIFNPATRSFFWRPAPEQAGTYPDVHFEVSDGRLTGSETISILVENADTAPPTINVINAAEIRPDGAVIHWITAEPATSQVEYWASPAHLTPVDENYVTDHTVVLSGLKPGTKYTYKTWSVDRSGNRSESEAQVFETPSALTVGDVTVTPGQAQIGEAVTIEVSVTNNLDTAATYDLPLLVGNAQESVVTVNLAPREKRTVRFTTTRYTAGSIPVSVGGVTGLLTIRTPGSELSKVGSWVVVTGVVPLAGISVVAFWWHRKRRARLGSNTDDSIRC